MKQLLMIGLAALGVLAASERPAHAQRVVTCESHRGTPERRVFCPMNTRRGVHVARQLSSTPCVRGRNFFVEAGGVYVRRGCRAVFASNRRPGYRG